MRRLRKKFKNPKIPWNTDLIKQEKEIMKAFGLKRKKEIDKEDISNFLVIMKDFLMLKGII